MNVRALFRKEAAAFFDTPAAYIVSVAFLLIVGYFFAQPLFLLGQARLDSFTDLAPLLLSFFVPAVTMRLVAEEMKNGTVEVLLTLPVADHEVLLAKYLAAVTVVWTALCLTFVYPLILLGLGRPDPFGLLGAYAGLALSGALLAAAGLLASALTRNQVVAFIVGFGLCFTLYLLGKVDAFMPPSIAPAAAFLGLDSHIDNLARGVFDTRDLLYYLTGTALFLALARVRLALSRSG